MQVTVFGASGRVGKLVVDEALRRGHGVAAFTHSQGLPKRPQLKVVQGDVHDERDISRAIKGSDSVISALGSWGTSSKDIVAAGTANIIPAMESLGVKRLVSLTGHGANAPGDKFEPLHFASRLLLLMVAAKILRDGERHIRLLAKSQLNWTVVRSPTMTKLGDPANFSLTDKRPWSLATVNRRSVANCLVDLAETKQSKRQAPYITRS